MEGTTVFYTFISLLFFVLALKFYLSRTTATHKDKNSLPSGPPSLGILGHLYLLKQQPMHHTLLKLSQKYGPIFSLRFGSRRVVVLTSIPLFQECFTKNDIVFANRPKHTLNKYVSYNSTTVTQSSYGEHWRNLRRIYAIEMFSNQRLNTFLGIRQDEVKRLLLSLLSSGSHHDFAKVELQSLFFQLNFNIIMRMVVGKRYYGEKENEPEARKFRAIMFDIANNAGPTYPGDFLPILKWTDFGKYERKVKRIGQKSDAFLQGLLDDHRSTRGGPESENSMLSRLLSLQKSQPKEYTDDIIKGIIMIMMLAGTDTSAIMLEWIFSNLVNKPEILEKARAEIDSQVGEENLVDEPELPNLRYTQAIISETLRLYPAAPLMVPHVSSDDCTLGGYHVPRNTMVLVNAWAIQRDPQLWDDPTSFKPERFLKGENENSKIIAFGIGRRACPGSGLSRRITGLCIASLIQCFEWKRVDDKLVAMDSGTGGVVVPKFDPLKTMCKARPIMNKLFPEAF
ncbi:cytochrome P450 81Q32-like [Tripterygium wilfordii]|nr:cytochrome P450 81Q32-like [Tripterygium wilfordii]